ncbi:hypothetical protein LCGC14_0431540 [marine sediment metagenome]|uniref:RNase NYN domain-containing protein n=1 Tax=marine sediment metagenome TaxID=412755 RepID=A0A0F9SU50_9ZZZZ|nr:hypothetical protein [Phycisphaerae bacterium]HDZ44771.1 hypothetical protein [Phycisphaerae bacterium]
MPNLIDGNNVLHALAEVGPELGRSGLCALLARVADPKDPTCIVFDGPRRGELPEGLAEVGIEAVFCPGRKADGVIIERLQADSAPRRLVVVSTDREIRREAQRRRCQSVTSEQFSRTLMRDLRKAAARKDRREPPEKHQGLADDQTDQWLTYFGLGGDGSD